MIVVIGGIKGGTGKTLLATNLAVMRSATGKKVLLVDTDVPQCTAYNWNSQRQALGVSTSWEFKQMVGKKIHLELQQLRNEYDDIIVDAGGWDSPSQRSSLTIADILIVPLVPRSSDMWSLEVLKTMIKELQKANPNLKNFVVINQADFTGPDNVQSMEIIMMYREFQCMNFTIGRRKAFSNAFSEGLAVSELKSPDKKATQEITSLYEEIYSLHS